MLPSFFEVKFNNKLIQNKCFKSWKKNSSFCSRYTFSIIEKFFLEEHSKSVFYVLIDFRI